MVVLVGWGLFSWIWLRGVLELGNGLIRCEECMLGKRSVMNAVIPLEREEVVFFAFAASFCSRAGKEQKSVVPSIKM